MKTKETTKLISILALTTLISGSGLHAANNVTLGGNYTASISNNPDDTRNTSNWTTNSTAASNSGSGLAFNWENVSTNAVHTSGTASTFATHWWTGWDHTIGHGFLFNDTFDLSLTNGGLTGLEIHTRLASASHANWRLIMSVDGILYQYDQTGNYYSGVDATQTRANIHDSTNWVNINNNNITGINDTLGSTNPNLQGTTGIVQFGFMQWSGSSSGNIYNFVTGVEVRAFEVDITYNAVPEPATFALLLGSAGLCFVMIRRRRKSLNS
jgi:hypothetical protein